MRRGKADTAAEMRRLEQDRASADTSLQALVAERAALLLEGNPEDVLDIDRRQSLELARIEAADARMARLRPIAEAEAREAAEAARLEAYKLAQQARADGVLALSEINEHLAKVAAARTRLVKAKAAVGEINSNLPGGYLALADPEPDAARGWPSILDQMRFPTETRQ